MAQVLIVGKATDGPTATVTGGNYQSLYNLFGGVYKERVTISPSASSLELSYEPLGPVLDFVVGQGGGQLYRPTASGTTLYFGPFGGSSDIQVDLEYTPYTGKSDLIAALKNYEKLNVSAPFVCRLGGVNATASASGWEIESIYPGSKYNGITFSISSSTLVITGFESNLSSLSYVVSSPAELTDRVNKDLDRGLSPIKISKTGESIADMTLVLSGGEDSNTPVEDFENLLSYWSLPESVSHTIVLSECTSSHINAVGDYLESEGNYPTVFIFPASSYTTSSIDLYVTQLNQSIPQRHDFVAQVLGDAIVTVDNTPKTRYVAELVGIGLTTNPYGFTKLQTPCESFSPVFNEDQLNYLASHGFMAPNRFIGAGPGIFKGVMSNPVVSSASISQRSILWSIMRNICYPYIGTKLDPGNKPFIEEQIKDSVALYSQIRLVSVQAYVWNNFGPGVTRPEDFPTVTGQVLTVESEILIGKEIHNITFNMRTTQ
jgi:hypothetical protein